MKNLKIAPLIFASVTLLSTLNASAATFKYRTTVHTVNFGTFYIDQTFAVKNVIELATHNEDAIESSGSAGGPGGGQEIPVTYEVSEPVIVDQNIEVFRLVGGTTIKLEEKSKPVIFELSERRERGYKDALKDLLSKYAFGVAGSSLNYSKANTGPLRQNRETYYYDLNLNRLTHESLLLSFVPFQSFPAIEFRVVGGKIIGQPADLSHQVTYTKRPYSGPGDFQEVVGLVETTLIDYVK